MNITETSVLGSNTSAVLFATVVSKTVKSNISVDDVRLVFLIPCVFHWHEVITDGYVLLMRPPDQRFPRRTGLRAGVRRLPCPVWLIPSVESWRFDACWRVGILQNELTVAAGHSGVFGALLSLMPPGDIAADRGAMGA